MRIARLQAQKWGSSVSVGVGLCCRRPASASTVHPQRRRREERREPGHYGTDVRAAQRDGKEAANRRELPDRSRSPCMSSHFCPPVDRVGIDELKQLPSLTSLVPKWQRDCERYIDSAFLSTCGRRTCLQMNTATL